MRVLILTAMLLILVESGCRRGEPLARDPASAKSEVSALVPNGTLVQTALASMEQKGFKCRVYDRTATEPKSYLTCVASQSGLLTVVSRRWLVRFEIKDERVYEPYVGVELTGP